MSKIQQEKLDKIAAALDRLAADMKDVKKGVGVIKTNTPTDASINSTIKNYSFGRSLAALNVGFDLAELKVMLALFGFNNDYCSDMFVAFLDKKHAPLLRLVQLLHWKHFGQEFDPSTVNTLVEDLEREARSAGACTSHIDCAMDKVAEFHNQALQFRQQNSTVVPASQSAASAHNFYSNVYVTASKMPPPSLAINLISTPGSSSKTNSGTAAPSVPIHWQAQKRSSDGADVTNACKIAKPQSQLEPPAIEQQLVLIHNQQQLGDQQQLGEHYTNLSSQSYLQHQQQQQHHELAANIQSSLINNFASNAVSTTDDSYVIPELTTEFLQQSFEPAEQQQLLTAGHESINNNF